MPLPVLHTYAGYAILKAYEHLKFRVKSSEFRAQTPNSQLLTLNSELITPNSKLSTLNFSVFSLRSLVFCLIIANLPDFDFIPGLLCHDASRFHHGISHSIGAALIAGLIAGVTGLYSMMQGSMKLKVQSSEFRVQNELLTPNSKLATLNSELLTPNSELLTHTCLRLSLLVSSIYCSHILLDILNGTTKGIPVLWPFSNQLFYGNPHLGTDPFISAGFRGFFAHLLSAHCLSRICYEILLVCVLVGLLGIAKRAKLLTNRAPCPATQFDNMTRVLRPTPSHRVAISPLRQGEPICPA